jgi:hypothetical protein
MVIGNGSVNGLPREILFFPGRSDSKDFAGRVLESELEEGRRLTRRSIEDAAEWIFRRGKTEESC